MDTIDFATCTPEEAMIFFAKDGVDFDTAMNAMIIAFDHAGRSADLERWDREQSHD